MGKPLPPTRFIGILKRHVGLEPITYDFHPDTETPHLFTFQIAGLQAFSRFKCGVSVSGWNRIPRSFSINAADLRVLMDQHGLLRVQSNEPNQITLYFGAQDV